jgi:hypothetical protein
MDDPSLIDEEQRRRKRNYARLRKEEENQKLIADGEGKISLSNQQNTNLTCRTKEGEDDGIEERQ